MDSTGLDAIYITDEDAVGGLGHSSVVMQDEVGNWWYCYWGNKEAVYEYIPPEFMNSLGDLNYYLNNLSEEADAHYSGEYDSFVYIQGDFSEGLNWLAGEIKKAGTMGNDNKNEDYTVLLYNCTVTSTIAMMKGTLPNGVRLSYYLKNNNIIPNFQFAHMVLTAAKIPEYAYYYT